MSRAHLWTMTGIRVGDIHLAVHKMWMGDLDGCIDMIIPAIDSALRAGDMFWLGHSVTVLVEALVHRGTDADLHAAQSAIDRLQAIPTETTFVLHEVQLLRMRALMAQAHGDDTAYRSCVQRYRTGVTECGYAGHMAIAETM